MKFLLRVALRRLDLAAEIYRLREPQKIPQVMSPDETRRLLAVAQNLKVRVLLSLGYGCGLRAGEVVRLPRFRRLRPWMVPSCRHPKTCTQPDILCASRRIAHRSQTH